MTLLYGAGHMHRNGHCRCGMCGHVEDRARGGKELRKAEGWRFHPSSRLGWLCSICIRRARAWDRDRARAAQAPEPSSSSSSAAPTYVEDRRGVRGFGMRDVRDILRAAEAPPRCMRDRRARLAARRAQERALEASSGRRTDRAANRPRVTHDETRYYNR